VSGDVDEVVGNVSELLGEQGEVSPGQTVGPVVQDVKSQLRLILIV
jgi:hypothetical protein